MHRKRVFDTLIEMHRQQRDNAASAAAEAQRGVEQTGRLVSQLREYRTDYANQTPKRVDNTTVTRTIELHQRFVDRLDVAIGDQVRRHKIAERERGHKEQELIEAQRRLKAFETVQSRREHAARALATRREQRATDEMATRMAYWSQKHDR